MAGAGLAGLAAARSLEGRGASVIVLDARNRVGGRVWTIRKGFKHGQHAEAGADMIDADQTALRAFVQDLGLRLSPVLKAGFGFCGTDRQGRICVQSAARGFASLAQPLAEYIHQYKLSEERWDSAMAQRMGRTSVAQWLASIKADAWLQSRMRGLRGFFLADPEHLSLLALVDFMATSGFSQAGAFRVRDGNDRIATAAAQSLAQSVQLRTILRRVREGARGLIATVDGESGRHEIEADFLVSAMPGSVVSDVQWDVPVPDVQRDAFARLRYGAATRLLVQCARRFWRKAGRPRAFGSDQPTGAVWDANEQQPGPAGILSFLSGGSGSAEFQRMLSTEPMDSIVKRVECLGRPARVLHAFTYTWENDPWVRGGYAAFDPSFDPRLREWLARPTGRVVFAGEHTSNRWQGYMNGAVESGQRAAYEIEALAAHPRGPAHEARARGQSDLGPGTAGSNVGRRARLERA